MRWGPTGWLYDLTYRDPFICCTENRGQGRSQEKRWETISIIQERGDGDWAKGTGCEKAVKDNSKVVVRVFYVTEKKEQSGKRGGTELASPVLTCSV